MSLNDTTTYLSRPGRPQRLALIVALGLLASNVFALQGPAGLAPMAAALSCVLAPIAALTGLLPRRALVPPLMVEANVIYRPLPERWVRLWMLAAPVCWGLTAPLALQVHRNGVFIAAGVFMVCVIVALELSARVRLEGGQLLGRRGRCLLRLDYAPAGSLDGDPRGAARRPERLGRAGDRDRPPPRLRAALAGGAGALAAGAAVARRSHA